MGKLPIIAIFMFVFSHKCTSVNNLFVVPVHLLLLNHPMYYEL